MLQGNGSALDLTGVGGATQLPGQLGALGEAGRAERVPLGDEAARRVHDPPATVCRLAPLDQATTLAGAAQAQRLVGQQFVDGEAVVQLDDVHIGRSETGLLIDALRGEAGTANFGLVQAGAIEQSNVDLTEQLVRMIVAQRNFQANAQMISTQDAVTQTIINLR